MQPRHVETGIMRPDEFRLDFVKRQRRRIDDAGIGGTLRQQLRWHDRACIETDRTTRDQVPPAYRDEVRRTRPRPNEMHRHGAAPVFASAQVTGPTAMRGSISRAAGPPAARAAASATDGTPTTAMTRSDFVTARAPAAIRSSCAITTSGTPIDVAAAAIPGSLSLAADVAIRRSSDVAMPARASAAMMAASIAAAAAPLRHPTPAT